MVQSNLAKKESNLSEIPGERFPKLICHFEENNKESAAIIKQNRSGSPYDLSTASPETLEDCNQHHHYRLWSPMLVATQVPNRH